MKRLFVILAGAVLVIGAMGVFPRLFIRVKSHSPSLSFDGLKDGDLIFHSSSSPQAIALQLITHSPYTHCGMLYKSDKEWLVLEAVQHVRSTPLRDWIKRGKEERFVVKRLKQERKLQSEHIRTCMIESGKAWSGRNYDPVFAWSDSALYCSELIYKIYLRCTGVRLGELSLLGSLDLSAPQVQELLYQRYGNALPLGDTVITPVSLFRSSLLQTVIAAGQYVN